MLAPRHSGQIMTKNVKTLFVGLCFVFANQIDSNKCHANSLILTRTFCFRSLFAGKKVKFREWYFEKKQNNNPTNFETAEGCQKFVSVPKDSLTFKIFDVAFC